MTEAILEVEGLRKTFGDAVAVADVSFSLRPGHALAVVGESGSGKTTVARMVVGLERPTAGRITACGRDRSQPPRSARERRRRGGEVQIVFQDPYSSLDPRQSPAAAVDEVLRLHTSLDPASRRRRVTELAGLVGLDERQMSARPAGLSGGQRQRVAIARALASEPRILILDESVAALDVSIQAQVLNVLTDVRERTGVAYLFISHDLAVVRQVADEIVVMRDGSIVERGPAARVLDEPHHQYTRLLRASVPGPGWRPARRAIRKEQEAR
ncbi:ABC transporter ATP-binding protein [Nonomuraea guangzhouensis]|uniref:ABC transporter ATP-binding protein n=1 Tax=Nonomuraea guangzhouensis TaxID=1291555 RepID=A0ABW4FY63_9ACTN|nr:ATP-binding cassette domain-containing protein [Nonomuraea guangzhouensis]